MRRDTIFAITAVCMVVLAPLSVGVSGVEAGSTTSSFDTDDSLSKWNGKTTPFTASLFGGGFEKTDDVVTHGAGLPGFYVGYENESNAFANVETWLNASDDRRLLYHDADDRVALIAAPGSHIRRSGDLLTFGKTGLSTRDYVSYVEVEQRVNVVEPVSLESKSTVETTSEPSRTAKLLAGFDGEFFTESGVAYSRDVNRTHMGDVRDTIAADRSSIPTSATGDNVTVAVLDTGARVGEQGVARGEVFGNGTAGSELRIKHGKNFVTGETIDTSSGNYSAIDDGNGHGMYTAARIAGAGAGNETVRSPAYESEIAVGKVLADDGGGSIQNIVRGLEWSCSDSVDADVVSMSLGSSRYSKTLADEIHSCLEDDGVSAITVAAGNSRWSTGRSNVGTPADVDGVIAVSATSTGNGTPASVETAYFANTGPDGGVKDGSGGQTRGEAVDIASPGMENSVVIIGSGGATETKTLSGTSMSTPDVATAAILLVDEAPSLKGEPDKVRERLLETASPAPQIGVTEAGHGVLNVSNALRDDRPELDQADARNEQAVARDEANRALVGSFGLWLKKRGVDL